MMALYQSRQEPLYSTGKSGGKGYSASLKNFRVQASTVVSQEEFEKSLSQEGIFRKNKGGILSDLPLFFESFFNREDQVNIPPYIST